LLPGDLAFIFFLFLIWFSDIESGASISSFWQSVLTSLEWFSKEQFLFGHWTLDGRLLFRGPKLLTPDLFLSSTLAHCHHVLLELPPIAANKAHRSGFCLDGSARVGVPASPNTVGHLVRLHRPTTVRFDVVVSVLLLSAFFARLLALTSAPLALSFSLAEPALIAGPADALVTLLPLVRWCALTLLAFVTAARVEHFGLWLLILVHVAARSNLVTAFRCLQEVDQLAVDVHLLKTAVEAGRVP